jgi:lambda repressor-like predicted transcriptional regulator
MDDMTGDLDPFSYKLVKHPEVDLALLQGPVGQLAKLGQVLWSMNVIPWIKDEVGHFRTAGNMAMRLSAAQGGGFIMTGTEVDKANLSAHSVVVVHAIDYKKGEMIIAGSLRPSREVIIADRLFSAFPDMHVMIHVHDGTILLNADVPTTQKVSWAATLRDGNEVVDLMKQHAVRLVNLRDHGQVIAGKDVQDCLQTLIRTHTTSLQHLQVCQV